MYLRRSAVAKVKAGVRRKKSEHTVTTVRDAGVYHGKQAKTGNSLGFRFERALFHSHPEFSGEVEAHIIGPGRMLVVADPEAKRRTAEEDPVLSSFMSFLAADMQRSPEHIKPLDASVMERIGTLVSSVDTCSAPL
jgi:prlF antitoxin for toxin YhaV_toxin